MTSPDDEAATTREAQTLFAQYDTDGNGELGPPELIHLLADHGYAAEPHYVNELALRFDVNV
eukprot:SAG11_NODE_16098_length_557_cov_0.576419_1_plen_62_part_00